MTRIGNMIRREDRLLVHREAKSIARRIYREISKPEKLKRSSAQKGERTQVKG